MSDNDHSFESTGSSPRFSNTWEDHGQEDHVDHGRTLDGKQKKYINGALFRVKDNISGDPCFDVAEYSLPMDIYTAVFASSLCLPPKQRSCSKGAQGCKLFLRFFPVFAGCALTLFAQTACLYYMWFIIHDMKQDRIDNGQANCSGGDFFLRIVCNCAYFVTMAENIKSSLNLCAYIGWIPAWNPNDEVILNKYDASFLLRRKIVIDKGRNNEERAIHLVVKGGVTSKFRAFMYSLFFLKTALEVALLYIGSAYILYAEKNEDLILNALSLAFVADLDNLAYAYLTTSHLKQKMEAMPTFGYVRGGDSYPGTKNVGEKKMAVEYWEDYGAWVLLIVFVLISRLIRTSWCGNEYTWDLLLEEKS